MMRPSSIKFKRHDILSMTKRKKNVNKACDFISMPSSSIVLQININSLTQFTYIKVTYNIFDRISFGEKHLSIVLHILSSSV